jgi:hypothetical protein
MRRNLPPQNKIRLIQVFHPNHLILNEIPLHEGEV